MHNEDMPALVRCDNCHKSTDYKRSTDNANMTRLNPRNPHEYINAAQLHPVTAQGSVKHNRVVRPSMLGNSLPVNGGKVYKLETSAIASACMWLRRFGRSTTETEPAGLSADQLKRFDENRARRRVLQWPTDTDSWRWLPRQDKKTAAVTKQRARRKIWWRRRTPVEAYWELREKITGRWRPVSTERNPIPQVRGRKPPLQPPPRPFSRRNLDAELERLEGLVDHVGVIAADRQRQRHHEREEARRRRIYDPLSAQEKPDLWRKVREYPNISTNATHASPSGLYPATWSHHCAPECRTPWQRDLRLADVGWNPTFIGGPSLPRAPAIDALLLPALSLPRKRQLNTDLSDEKRADGKSMFWSSTMIEPKGCRQLVWKTGKPPEPIGKEFPSISTGSTHIRNVMRQINGVKKLTPAEERELVLRFYDSNSDIDCATMVNYNLRIASIHANRRAGFNESYNNLLGASVLAMLKALRKGKFDPGQGTRLSTFFERVVDSRIKDVLKKENLYYRRHAFSDFRDNEDDGTDGEPIEKTDAVRLAVENKTAEEWIGEDNMVDQLEEIVYYVDGLMDGVNRWIIKCRYYLNRSSRELGGELWVSEDTVQRRQTRALAELRMKLS